MIAKYFLWVYLCIGQECDCERITFGANKRQLYLKTSKIELLLDEKSRDGNFHIMTSDSARYAVYGQRNDHGMIVFINRITPTYKVDQTIVFQFRRDCLPEKQL